MGAAAMSAAKGVSATPMGKTEALLAFAFAYGFAQVGEHTMPPEQALYTWSVAGTIIGAVLGGLHLKRGGWMQRIARFAMCFFGGLVLAPFAIARIPKADATPEWWHAFAASGIAAFLAWIMVEEAGPLLREAIEAWRAKRRKK